MDEWGWEHLLPWLTERAELPVGPLFCIIDGPIRGRPWSGAAVRSEFRRLAAQAGVRRRFAPHQLRHAHALELAREGVPLNIIQRQLGHANLGTTSIYLQGIDPEEIIAAVRARRAPIDVGQRRAATLSDCVTSGSAPALPLRLNASGRLHPHTRDDRASSGALAP
jgi:DNA-binding transcriptional MerR regulator